MTFYLLIALANTTVNAALAGAIGLRWDAGWYANIAENGYRYAAGTQSTIAFFPLFPTMIRIIRVITGDSVTAGLWVVNIAFFVALVVLYRLIRLEIPDDEASAERSLLYTAFFPCALFFSIMYTESLFLMLTVLCFYCARRHIWWGAIACGMLASATRVTGALMFGVVALEWARSHGFMLSTITQRDAWRGLITGLRREWLLLLAIGLIPLGVVSYMVYLQVNFGDPWLFRTVQIEWGRSTLLSFQSVVNESRIVIESVVQGAPVRLASLLNLSAVLVSLVLVVPIWRRFGTSYGAYTLLATVIPISTGLLSNLRYSMVLFPLTMIMGVWGGRSKGIHYAILCLFCALYGMLILLFASDVFFE